MLCALFPLILLLGSVARSQSLIVPITYQQLSIPQTCCRARPEATNEYPPSAFINARGDSIKRMIAAAMVPLLLLSTQQPVKAIADISSPYTSTLLISSGGGIVKFDPTVVDSEKNNNNDKFRIPITFEYSNEKFAISPKLVKTHYREYFFKAEGVSGFNFGLTVDLIRKDINGIKEVYSSAQSLADKLMEIERNKDGHIASSIVSASEKQLFGSSPPSSSVSESSSDPREVVAYDIEYVVESTRGLNHYKTRTFVDRGKVFVFTIQCKEKMFT